MTKKYCKGKKLEKGKEGVMTCSKARSVFYATMKSRKIDYTKAPTQETIQYLEQLEAIDVDTVIKWFERKMHEN